MFSARKGVQIYSKSCPGQGGTGIGVVGSMKRTIPITVTAEAPVNIALIKYWGKRDVKLNLATNSSLGVVLESENSKGSLQLFTRTKVTMGEAEEDTIILNGEGMPINNRTSKVLEYIRGIVKVSPITIESENLFPTAAGLASSASGYAALVKAISTLVEKLNPEQESIAARLGSGSACRSLQDGFVLWKAGTKPDGSDSIARSIFPAKHWPELCCLVFVFSPGEKQISSGIGMERTVATSSLFPRRLEVVGERIDALQRAIERCEFPEFAEIVMRDSNQFHAVCMDSLPPIFYLNQYSHCVIEDVHRLNVDSIMAAYTFDAGPNAFVFCTTNHVDVVERSISTALLCMGLDMTGKIIRCRVGSGARAV